VPPENAEAFAQAIVRLADDEPLRAALGKRAREYAEQYLDKDKVISDYEKKLIALVSSASR
jgi:colanic acid biosynthesis glycosyl transferase WcaI